MSLWYIQNTQHMISIRIINEILYILKYQVFKIQNLNSSFDTYSKFQVLNRPHQASLVAQTVKNLPVTWETWVWSLVWEDSLEKGMAIHSSILAWWIPMDREAWRATVRGVSKESDTTEWLGTQ